MSNKKKWYQYVGVKKAFIVACASIIVAGMYIWNTRSQLVQDNIKYLGDIKRKDETIGKLRQQLIPFKTIALAKYAGSEEERLKKLAEDIAKLKDAVDPLKKPIASATVDVEVIIKPKPEENFGNAINMTVGEKITFFNKQDQGLLFFSASSLKTKQNGYGEATVSGILKIVRNYSVMDEPVEVLRELDFIRIKFSLIRSNSSVLGGNVFLVINGDQSFNFAIPPQQADKKGIITVEITSDQFFF